MGWERTLSPLLVHFLDGTMINILFGNTAIGIPQQVEGSKVGKVMSQIENPEDNLKNQILLQEPSEL